MCLSCCDCGQSIARRGVRGRNPKRCQRCRLNAKAARSRVAEKKPLPGRPCLQCCTLFFSPRHAQKFCSTDCMHLASRNRVTLVCANAACSKTFEAMPNQVAKGRRHCCKECSYPPPLVCQNPKCGREFRMKHRTNDTWKNQGKYCCPECYRDHRWGEHRPRKRRSRSVRQAAASTALATSLRKRCKVFGVTLDPACTRQAVLERDGWRCQKCRVLCNKEYVIDPKTKAPHLQNAEHDHIIPLSVPGSPGNTFENSQCLCRSCNSKKGDTPDGQLRICFEENAWGRGVRVRHRRNSKSSVAIQAAAL